MKKILIISIFFFGLFLYGCQKTGQGLLVDLGNSPFPSPTASPSSQISLSPSPTASPSSQGTCCKCFWHDTGDQVGMDSKGMCENWLARQTDCSAKDKEIVRIGSYEELLCNDYACGEGYATAKYQFYGHGNALTFEPVYKFCKNTPCPNVIGDIEGCNSFENYRDAYRDFILYDGDKNIDLKGSVWIAGTGTPYTKICMTKIGTCRRILYPYCGDVDINDVTGEENSCHVSDELVPCSNTPGGGYEIDEYRLCCCERDWDNTPYYPTRNGRPMGTLVRAFHPFATCDNLCFEGNTRGSSYGGPGHYVKGYTNTDCSVDFDSCGIGSDGIHFKKLYDCYRGGSKIVTMENCEKDEVCVDEYNPKCIPNPGYSPSPSPSSVPSPSPNNP